MGEDCPPFWHHLQARYKQQTTEQKKFSISKPEYTVDVQLKQKQRVEILNLQSVSIIQAIEAGEVIMPQVV